jgi:hypothetical protein
MQRQLFVVVASAWLLASVTTPALAGTWFTPKGIKVVDQWIVGQTDRKLSEAPRNILDDKANQTRFGYLDNQGSFDKLWKAWRTGDPPRVDFTKHIVLVLTHVENAKVAITATLENNGTLEISVSSTERRPNGMTYVLAVVERSGIKNIGKVPLKPVK